MNANCKWYVVQTHPNAEMRAAEHLRRQSFEVYMPRFRKLRCHARKTETVIRPLFPRYFFVAFDLAERWQAIRSTIGISSLIGGENGPIPLATNILQDLKRREDEHGFIKFEERQKFVRGDKIEIINGVLSASKGLFEEMADHDRVTLLLEMLGRQVRVIVDCEHVAHA